MTETPFYDAYAHVGLPRFASARDAWEVIQRWNIGHANFVLFPGSPDFEALLEVRRIAGDKVRLFGIPFGSDEEERRRYAELQVSWGVSGIRLMPFELEPHRVALEVMGEAGRWLFAINPYENEACAAQLLDWLERHPQGRIASPHFLRTDTIGSVLAKVPSFEGLLDHPRFFAILSRQGGAGEGSPDPYVPLHSWVEGIADRMGWDRLMWGSEFPVLYWRDELIDEAQGWLRRLLPHVTDEEWQKFTRDNTRRLFYDEPAPAPETEAIPEWVQPVAGSGPATYFGAKALQVPADLHAQLMQAYFHHHSRENQMRFSDHLLTLLRGAML